MKKLSLAVLTFNSQRTLETCLKSARDVVDEIVVVDSGSPDDTLAVAERNGARIVHQDWLGFGPRKRLASSLCSYDWVLSLDSDESLSDDLRATLREWKEIQETPSEVMAFSRLNRFLGRDLRHGEGYPDWCPRLFNRRRADWSMDLVHEKVTGEGVSVKRVRADILHDSSETLAKYISKQVSYAQVQAPRYAKRSWGALLSGLFLSPTARFLKNYFFRRGFQDGVPGLVHALIGGLASFLKFLFALELKVNRR